MTPRPVPDTMGSVEGDKEQSLIGHLVELRSRLLRAVVAVMVVFLGLVPFANRIYAFIAAPSRGHLPEAATMVAIDVASPFLTPIKLTFFVAMVVAMPVVLYQLWAFVAPGLYRHEQRLAKPLLASAVLLFYAGCAFAYFLVLPAVFAFLTSVAPEGVSVMTDISRYLDFVLVLFLAFGFSFEVPVAVVILVLLGWVDVAQLREARGYVVVGAFIVAAVITPPDVISQLMLAIPMCLLYEAGIVAAAMLARRRAEPQEPAERP
ncbi:MAG TPA: twin-arginine translocase subunit TatC [Chiayiivirga sp.]|nr:twin-arginine translocase subunit TatC [Chiayiivirga sp.]